jgi:type VII secretion protein EccE
LTSDKPGVFHRLPLPVILPAATLGAGVGTAVIAFHGPLLAALGAGVVVAAFGALRVHERNVWRILGMRLALRWRERRHAGIAPSAEPFDVPVPETGGDIYGMRWDGRCLITMLRVEPRGVAPTLMSPTVIRTADEVPLDEVARCLSQFDIRLAAIDVVALGVRVRGNHEAVRIYEQILGSLPATATRTVWLVLRFDPLDNAEAIGNRGGGTEGTVRTAMVATRRVVNRLARHGVRVRVLSAAGLTAAESAARHDTDPGQWREDWHALRCNEIELAGYAIRPDRLNSDVLAGIWAVSGLSTMVRLRVCPAEGADARRESGGRVAVTALVRHDVAGSVTGEVRTALSELGLRSLTGVQRQVLLEGEEHAAAAYGVPAALTRLTVPSGGCGQVIGATADGFGVAVPMFGPAVRRVEIVGSLRLVQQTTLRAMAVGARVIVHSARPQDWAHLAAQIDAPEALSVSRPGVGAQHTAAATLIVYDGVASAGQVSEATVVHVRAPDEEVSMATLDADVVLIESAERDEVHIRTAAGELTVRMVSIPEELRYLSAVDPSEVETLQPA